MIGIIYKAEIFTGCTMAALSIWLLYMQKDGWYPVICHEGKWIFEQVIRGFDEDGQSVALEDSLLRDDG